MNWKKILEKYSKELQSTILKIAHHGSKTSTTSEFLKAVNPQYALIGVGKNNKFGHPSEITINKLKEMNKNSMKFLKELSWEKTTDEFIEILDMIGSEKGE